MIDKEQKQARIAKYNAKQAVYKAKYDKENMKTFSVKIRIELNEKLENHIEFLKIDDKNANRNKFVTAAIMEKLERDSRAGDRAGYDADNTKNCKQNKQEQI